MKRILIFIFCLWGCTQWARADRWTFLPSEPLFNPLIGDLREPQYAIVAQPMANHYDGAIGQAIEFIRWQPHPTTYWAWGMNGASFLELDSLGGDHFPLRVSDWYLGTYLSEKSGKLSNRLEYEHVSSHLGDELFFTEQRIIYSRESLKFISSYDFSPYFRLYGGPGFWTHISPDTSASRLIFQAGVELYTPYSRLVFGTHIRGYATYNLQVFGEAGGVIDQTFQVGIQWRWKRDTAQSIRMAALFYTGNNLYGQFYQDPDSFLGLGIFFDP